MLGLIERSPNTQSVTAFCVRTCVAADPQTRRLIIFHPRKIINSGVIAVTPRHHTTRTLILLIMERHFLIISHDLYISLPPMKTVLYKCITCPLVVLTQSLFICLYWRDSSYYFISQMTYPFIQTCKTGKTCYSVPGVKKPANPCSFFSSFFSPDVLDESGINSARAKQWK